MYCSLYILLEFILEARTVAYSLTTRVKRKVNSNSESAQVIATYVEIGRNVTRPNRKATDTVMRVSTKPRINSHKYVANN